MTESAHSVHGLDTPTLPFSAVVGMDDMRLALILNAVSPAIGGVLIRGEKGSAKSTMVRALAAVLPPIKVVGGCRFSCDPLDPDPGCPDGPHDRSRPGVTRPARLVELPVGASDDRLTGSLDLERALTQGVKAYEPGLLAAANRGILYVDEVNLLHDHLVDLLLDSAALGTSYVEREGVSVRHAARFLLVGTMNPEEGELRPQLLDRFGLTVTAAAPREPEVRAEVVRRRLAFDADPDAMTARYAAAEEVLASRIRTARDLLRTVVLSDAALRQITSVCAAFEVDGLRADLVMARAAIAHAAWDGRTAVDETDIAVAARLALPHRKRRNPFDAPDVDEQQLEQALQQAAEAEAQRPPDVADGSGDNPTDPTNPDDDGPEDNGPEDDGPDDDGPGGGPSKAGPSGPTQSGRSDDDDGSAEHDQSALPPMAIFRARLLQVPGVGAELGAAGQRSRAGASVGRTTRAELPTGRLTRLHLAATLFAAAPHQRGRGRDPRGHEAGFIVHREDLRQARVEGREGNLVLFVVDASGSMAARSRMSAVTGAVLSLLLDAYQRRDKVGLITFRGTEADLALPPTSSVEAAAARISALPTGGRTPLATGLLRAHEVLRIEKLRDPRRRPLLVVVTDGRATSGGGPLTPVVAAHRAAAQLHRAAVASVVIDCESGPVRLGLAGALARELGGVCLELGELAAGELADTVRVLRQVA